MPPIVFIGASTVSISGGALTLTNLPARTANDDLILAVFNLSTGATLTPPDSSWLVQVVLSTSVVRIVVAAKIRTASDGPSYRFTTSATVAIASTLVYRGAQLPTAASLQWTGQTITASTVFTASGQNLTTYSDMLVAIAASSGSFSFTPDPQMIERVDANGGNRSISIDDYQPNAVGVITQRTLTASGSTNGGTASIRIQAAPTINAPMLRSDAVGAMGFNAIGV